MTKEQGLEATKRKVKKGFIISIDHETDENEFQVPDRTRIEKRRVVVE